MQLGTPIDLWLYRVALVAHVAAVVVWFGAVAYFLLVLRPAMRQAQLNRPARYALINAIKWRLKRVVGASIIVLIVTGLYNAHRRGLLPGETSGAEWQRHVFYAKMLVVGALVLIFLTALPTLKRVQPPRRRARLFIAVHVVVLALGLVAAGAGIMLSR